MVDSRSRLHRAFLDDFCAGLDRGRPVLGFRDWLSVTPLAVGLTVGLGGCRQASSDPPEDSLAVPATPGPSASAATTAPAPAPSAAPAPRVSSELADEETEDTSAPPPSAARPQPPPQVPVYGIPLEPEATSPTPETNPSPLPPAPVARYAMPLR